MEHQCKVTPKFEKHGDIKSFLWFECECGKKYAKEDLDIPEGFGVSFGTTA